MSKKTDTNEKEPNLEHIFPDPLSLFENRIPPLTKEILEDCCVVLDTNVLLVPYASGKQSVAEIAKVYNTLKDNDQLFIPKRVLREFFKNRIKNITTIYHSLSELKAKTPIPKKIRYPLLEDSELAKDLNDSVEAVTKSIKAYHKTVERVMHEVEGWGASDPVSQLYGEIFTRDMVCTPDENSKDIEQKRQFRYDRNIPPGYKDAGKSDGGVGDLIIWLTILAIGRREKKPLVFVTGEEKADWRHRSNNKGLMARIELVDEYYQASKQSFYLVRLSELLEMVGVEDSVVEKVQQEESHISYRDKTISQIIDEDTLHTALTKFIDVNPEFGSLPWYEMSMALESMYEEEKGNQQLLQRIRTI